MHLLLLVCSWWWELVEMFRKLMLTSIIIFVRTTIIPYQHMHLLLLSPPSASYSPSLLSPPHRLFSQVAQGTPSQIVFGMFVAFIMLVLHTNQSAYEDNQDDLLQFAALLGVFMVICL